MTDKPKMHVVVYLPSIETGGVERNAILVANYLACHGVKTSLVYTRSVPGMLERFDENVERVKLKRIAGIPFVHPRLIDAVGMLSAYIRYLKNAATAHVSDVIVLSFQSNIVSVVAGKSAKVPVIVRVSNHPSHSKYSKSIVQKLSEKLKLIFYKYADAVVTNSKVTSEYFRKKVKTPVYTIYNPVSIGDVSRHAREGIEHPWLMPKLNKVVVAVGRLSKQKNFSLLIKSFREVVNKEPAKLIIVGEGSERDFLERIISQLHLDDCVDLIGYQTNVHKWVAASDLFVLSSLFEGLPNALLDAVALGVPAVSTDCLSGPREILCDGDCGILVKNNDVHSLAEGITEGLSNINRVQNNSEMALNNLKEFEMENVLAEYHDLLQDVILRKNAI